jgi:hypothetical protein
MVIAGGGFASLYGVYSDEFAGRSIGRAAARFMAPL